MCQQSTYYPFLVTSNVQIVITYITAAEHEHKQLVMLSRNLEEDELCPEEVEKVTAQTHDYRHPTKRLGLGVGSRVWLGVGLRV